MPRWDKEREYLICDAPRGRGRCGGRLGRRVLQSDGSDALGMLPGWERGNGVWHEPPHDFSRRQHGYRPRPLPGKVSEKKRDRGESSIVPMFPLDGPLRVRCSDCQTEHGLRADLLGVSRAPAASVVTLGANP